MSAPRSLRAMSFFASKVRVGTACAFAILIAAAAAPAQIVPPQSLVTATTPEMFSAATREAVNRQTVDDRQKLVSDLTSQIAKLKEELNSEIAKRPRNTDRIKQINDSLAVKQQAYDLASGDSDKGSPAAAESYTNTSNPYFLMCGHSYWAPKDTLKWSDKLKKTGQRLNTIGRSVGLIYLDDRPIGTGFVVQPGYIMTNKHVLEALAYPNGTNWTFRGKVATIRFDREFDIGQANGCDTPNPQRTYRITLVYETAKGSKRGDDLAILLTGTDDSYPPKLSFSKREPVAYFANMTVAVIGYPGVPRDMTVLEQEEFFSTPTSRVPRFFYKRISGGYTGENQVTEDGVFTHLANTSGGNSGSPIIDLSDGTVVGVHVWGYDRFLDEMGYNLGIVSNKAIAFLVDSGLLPSDQTASR